jgi:hypothetical protein
MSYYTYALSVCKGSLTTSRSEPNSTREGRDGRGRQPWGVYVLLSAEGDSCTCKGHTYGGYCKHADAVRALRQAGKL